MKRRDMIGLFGGVSIAWPDSSHAQPAEKRRRIAFVHSGIPVDRLTETAGPLWVRRFFEELRRLGHVEGPGFAVERYSAEGRSDRFAAVVAAVVGSVPDVIVTNSIDLTKAFAAATATIPIVAITSDPIAGGLLSSLARPGRNLTGASVDAGQDASVIIKRLQILKEALPRATKVAFLVSSRRSGLESLAREAEQNLGIAVFLPDLPEATEAQIRRSFAEMAQQKVDAVVVDESGNLVAHRRTIIALAETYALPTIYPYRDDADLGGLLAYGPDLGEIAKRLADDVHQILNGTKPGDIPYLLPTKFELAINLKTAKALGLAIPPILLARADEVIE